MEPVEKETVPVKNVSYLYARDPSIISYGRPWGHRADINNCKKNLIADLGDETHNIEEQLKGPDTVQTYLRIKKTTLDKELYNVLDNITLQCNLSEGSINSMRNIKEGDRVLKKYKFSKIFGPSATQTELFDEVVKPKLVNFINGSNYSLLTYGASGSGKTFTIVGTAQEPGLIPRALEYLFRSLPSLSETPKILLKSNGTITRISDTTCKRTLGIKQNLLNCLQLHSEHVQHTKTYRVMQKRLSAHPVATVTAADHVTIGVWVSFAEIYNEHIYDLLQTPPTRGQQRTKLALGNCNDKIYIKNLLMIPVSSGLEAYQILQYGLRNLNYASTNINACSSRSHCIFTIKLVQASEHLDGYNVSYFNFCDLAGSERLKKTLNVGDRLKESNNINTSLHVLGRCIKAIRDSQKQHDSRLIPFRESKLTLYFKHALSGLEDISMIVNINPCKEMFDETHHVLNFSAIAKDIVIEQPIKPKLKITNRFSEMVNGRSTACAPIAEASEAIEELQDALMQLAADNENLRVEIMRTDERARMEVKEAYEEMIALHKRNFQDRIHNIQQEHERKMRDLKQYYERKLSDRAEVINLDSSSDEDDGDGKGISAIKEELCLKQQKITELTLELQRVKNELESVKMERDNLQEVLETGVRECRGLQQQVDELEKERNNLKKQILELEEELDIAKDYVESKERSTVYASNENLVMANCTFTVKTEGEECEPKCDAMHDESGKTVCNSEENVDEDEEERAAEYEKHFKRTLENLWDFV